MVPHGTWRKARCSHTHASEDREINFFFIALLGGASARPETPGAGVGKDTEAVGGTIDTHGTGNMGLRRPKAGPTHT